MTSVNGEPALAVRAEGRLFSIITVRTDGMSILDVFTVLNPNKLSQASIPPRPWSRDSNP